nr:MAG TPA: hypothetical protein [Caudoviricetes sp.]
MFLLCYWRACSLSFINSIGKSYLLASKLLSSSYQFN